MEGNQNNLNRVNDNLDSQTRSRLESKKEMEDKIPSTPHGIIILIATLSTYIHSTRQSGYHSIVSPYTYIQTYILS